MRTVSRYWWSVRLARYGATLLALLHCGTHAAAQQTLFDSRNKSVPVPRTSTPPVIDGVLNEAVWQRAAMIDDMHQMEPVDHGAPSERTEIYLLYDDDFLYVGARLFDSEPARITARQMVQGQTLQYDDALHILLDTFNNKRTGYDFEVNPNGVRIDGIFETPSDLNRDWEGVWLAEAAIGADGWSVEYAIPFKTLNFDPGNSDWGFSIRRKIARKKEEIAWVSYNRQVNPGATGLITGLTGLEQGKGLDVVPSLIVGESKNFATGETRSDIEPALDIIYKLTPSLTGLLTFNTDFSATEVDDRQINLTRFSLFFPEKRDFFLQDADIFAFGGLSQNGIPFFSRRIGLSTTGQPVDLEAGAKLTGRVGRWNVGVLDVEQDGFGGVEGSNLFVGRVAANVLRESSVGLIVTDGDPRSNLDNSVAAMDFRYRNTSLPSGRVLEGEAWLQESDTEGIETDQKAWGLRFATPKSEGFEGSIGISRLEANFNPALGFVNRANVIEREGGIRHTTRPEQGRLRRFEQGLFYREFERISGGLESSRVFFQPIELQTNSGDELGTQITREREVLLEDFEISDGIVIAPGDYAFTRYGIELAGARERALAPRFEVTTGEFFLGDRLEIIGGIDWRPTNRIFLAFAYEYNDISLPEGQFTTRLIQANANFAINARWSWVNLVQYDNVSGSAGLNSRVRWNARAGQDLYIVVNHGFSAAGAFSGLESERAELSIKYTHTFRF